MFLKSILMMCVCLAGMGAKADLLIPLNLFAEKSKDSVKAHVFVWNGDQYSCDSPSAVYFKTEEEAKKLCGLCPNRVVERTSGGNRSGHLKINGKTYYSCENESCLKCSDEGWCGGGLGYEEVKDVYACIPKSIKKCPADKPLLDTFGFCHACGEEKGIHMSWTIGKSAEENQMSTVCDNRKMRSNGNGKKDLYSILNECPKSKPLQDVVGDCYKCDDPKAVCLSRGRHGKPPYGKTQKKDPFCSNRQRVHESNPLTYSEFSALKTCPKDMPLRDQEGGCHSCSEKREVMVGNVVWGTINKTKVYDETHKLIGYLEKGIHDKKRNQPVDLGLPGMSKFERRMLYNLQKEVMGYVEWEDFHYVNIYNLKYEKIAYKHSEADAPDFDGTYYFWGTFPDKVCPNREVRELFSVLKK